ncbi:MAG: IS110 family transposase [Candidatus Hydrogenedentota bacterium]|nr:MAG: IS110 family transposase [Candidatus Hydrogenedentota bacterium]
MYQPVRNQTVLQVATPSKQNGSNERADIARHLLVAPEKCSYERPAGMLGVTILYRRIRRIIRAQSELKNELHALLIQVQPQLVRFCRENFPQWILLLLMKYPTAAKLGRASIKRISAIPFISSARARTLKEEAKNSVGALQDSFTETAISCLARSILEHQKEIDELKKKLIGFWEPRRPFHILISIPAFGKWSAAAFLSEICTIFRFHSGSALVAYSGVDPIEEQSGDMTIRKGISHRGNSEIRAILYPVILAAIKFNPVIREFYTRLRAAGKPHKVAVTAAMNKMLRIVYACMVTEQDFDPEYAKRFSGTDTVVAAADSCAESTTEDAKDFRDTVLPPVTITAPVTRRQARKRRETALTRSLRDQRLTSQRREPTRAGRAAPVPPLLKSWLSLRETASEKT